MRPRVLEKMPLSCNVVFDVLNSMSSQPITISVGELAQISRLSKTQCWRALRRLHGARLIMFVPGRGHRPSTIVVRPRSPHPRVSSSPSSTPSSPSQRKRISHTDKGYLVRRAMHEVREEIRRWPLSWSRRNRLLTAAAIAVRDLVRRNIVQDSRSAVRAGRWLTRRMGAASGISCSTRRAIVYARWLIKDIQPRVEDIQATPVKREDKEDRREVTWEDLRGISLVELMRQGKIEEVKRLCGAT